MYLNGQKNRLLGFSFNEKNLILVKVSLAWFFSSILKMPKTNIFNFFRVFCNFKFSHAEDTSMD
jgi:hypothetical protein